MATGLMERKTKDTYLKDAEYIWAIKDPETTERMRQNYRYELFTKYIPLMRKMARKFNLSKEDTEDYISEGFFVVMKVIDYTDARKIDENYSFGYFLRFNLLNKGIQGVKKSKRRESKVGTQISWDAVVEGGNFRPDEMIVPEEEALEDSEVYNQGKQAISLLTSIPSSRLSDRDKRILTGVIEGYNCRELASKFAISQQRILKIKKAGLEVLKEYATAVPAH